MIDALKLQGNSALMIKTFANRQVRLCVFDNNTYFTCSKKSGTRARSRFYKVKCQVLLKIINSMSVFLFNV